MKKPKSNVFKAGQRLPDTMLTIIGPAHANSWIDILCRCDCGREVVLPYMAVYRRKFSCGCKARRNAVDYTGVFVHNSNGNTNSGRTLEVLYNTPDGWAYLCDCCASVFTLPRGMDTQVIRSLKDIAGRPCPNHLPFCPVDRIERLIDWIGNNFHCAGRDEIAVHMATRYPKSRVLRDGFGKILGFYGMPASGEGDKRRNGKVIALLKEEARLLPVPIDPDGFGADPELVNAYVEPTDE